MSTHVNMLRGSSFNVCVCNDGVKEKKKLVFLFVLLKKQVKE